MSSPVVSIPPEVPAMAALGFMERRKVRRLPVVEGGRLKGIVTLGDLHADRHEDAFVEELMSKDPLTVAPDETLECAAKIMIEKKISGIPVVDAEDHVVGIITESDVFRALCELLGVKEKGARVVFSVPDDGDLLDSLHRRLGNMVPRSLATFHNAERGCWEVVTRLRGRSRSCAAEARGRVPALKK
jgi:acetoin utilization protein AcuB